MQPGLLTGKVRSFAALLALLAFFQAVLAEFAEGQQRDFGPVSTLGPMIEPQDLAFESTFADPQSDNPLRSTVQTGREKLKWVASKVKDKPVPAASARENRPMEKEVGESSGSPLSTRWIRERSEPRLRGPNLQFAQGPEPQQEQGIGATSPRSVAVRLTQPSPAATSSKPSRRESKAKRRAVASRTASMPRASSKPPKVLKQPPLSKQQKQLRTKVRRVLTQYYQRPMNTQNRSPWEIMHAMLAYEVHSQVLQGGPRGEPITAVGWLCFNKPCKRRTLLYVNDTGQMRVKVGPALQGHHGQLLAMLAQSSVNKEYPIRIDEEQFTIADLIEMEKQTCYPRTELTFKLISLMHYLDSDAQWLNDQGLQWDIPRLIREELRQPVRGAACGGTHRLTGLTLAYKTRIKRRQPVDGEYLRAKKFIQNYQRYAYRLQNSDGSFSTEWFRGRGDREDVERRLKTTGHILEWLLYSATEKELHHPQTARAVNYLANIMTANRYRDWEAGPLGHAVHALLLYDRKVFGRYDRWNSNRVAKKPSRQQKR